MLRLLLPVLLLPLGAIAQTPFALEKNYWQAALFLRTTATETEEHNGRTYEVLLRDKETGETLPKNAIKRGTAFLVKRADGKLFLVTATHVTQPLTPESQLAFLNRDGNSRAFHLRQILTAGEDGAYVWRDHASNDVSAMALALSPEQQVELEPLALPEAWLETGVPNRLTGAVVCGYPMGLGAYKRISPITSPLTIASEEIEVDQQQRGIAVKTAVLVTPPAGPGFSGGPIFIPMDGESPRCVGLLSGSFGDAENAVFSAFVPARCILELLREPAPAPPAPKKG